jgi:phenylacetate-coenzyme A ligase PaaK-like adenylate-forming protein
VLTTVSSAVRVALAARAAGLSLEGVTFSGGGEPLTETRRANIEASGARAYATYAANEMTSAAGACATPRAADDVHFADHRNAVIARPRALPDGPVVEALLFSSVSPAAPKLMLNTDLGDYARVERRDCECALGRLGLRTHLSDIRSFEKLSGEGTSFACSNIDSILEEVLPARFGGASTDYQLLEQEGEGGATCLVLRVHPAIGALDEAALRAALLAELERGGVVEQYQARLLARVGAVTIRRQPPLLTRGGKILPFQLVPRALAEPSRRSAAGRPTTG